MTWRDNHNTKPLSALKVPVDDDTTLGGSFKYASELSSPAGTSDFVGAAIVGGHLMLTKSDGTTVDLGNVQGAGGAGFTSAVVTGSGHLVLTKTDGTMLDLGNIQGAAGVSFTGAALAGGHLVLTKSDGTMVDLGNVEGAAGPGFSGATITGAGHLVLTKTDNTKVDLGNIQGNAATRSFVNARPPAASDDATSGYHAGQFWRLGADVWQCMRDTASKAIWVPYASGAAPLDLVGGAIAAYGIKRLRSAYGVGPAIDVQLTNGGTVSTISFLPDGTLDTAALEAALGGATGRVSRRYDHTGNGNHATQSTFASMPGISISNTIGGARAILYDAAVNGQSGNNVSMVLPAGVTANSQSVGIVTVARVNSTAYSAPLVTLNNPSYPYNFGVYFSSRSMQVYFGGTYDTALNGPLTPFMAAVTSSSSAMIQMVKDITIPSGGMQYSQPLAGGFLGFSQSFGGYGNFEEACTIIYPRTLLQPDLDAMSASLSKLFDLSPQVRDVVAFDGDSITFGLLSTKYQSFPRKLIPLLEAPATVYDAGYIGQTLASRIDAYPTSVAPSYAPGARNNILVIWAGTNDVYISGSSGAAVYASYQSYVTQAKATGWKVIVATISPRASINAAATALNTLLRAGWNADPAAGGVGADGFVDVASDPTMGTYSGSYYGDATHPNDAGYSYLAALFAPEINRLML